MEITGLSCLDFDIFTIYRVNFMYELIRHSLLQKILPQQLLSGGTAFVVADRFYHFHSFSLECIAFLITWGVLDFLVQNLSKLSKMGIGGH